MLQMWGETSLINYEDFVLLMKGQKKWDSGNPLRNSLQGFQGPVLPEILEDDEDNATPYGSFVLGESSPQLETMLNELSPIFSNESSVQTLPGARAFHTSLMQCPFTDYPTDSLTRAALSRGRSVSLDERDTLKEEADYRKSHDSRQAMIPEHTTCLSDIDRVVQDETKTPLVVNRTLYRAQREFRHAFTEACKQFEDEQMRRAKETLRAQESAGAKHTAGLVMRHGQALSDQSIKKFLAETIEEQQKQVDQANRRGGRGRHSRKKTTSDMSGMLSGPTPPSTPEMGDRKKLANQEALARIEEDERKVSKHPDDDTVLRRPTIPGEFRRTTYDPFHPVTASYT